MVRTRRMLVQPKIITSLSACKESAQYIDSFLQYSGFYSLMNQKAIFEHPTKNHWSNFYLSWICTSIKKICLLQSVHSWDTVIYRVLWPDCPHPFLTMPTPNVFDQFLIYVDLYEHAKNQAISLICSGDMVDSKILRSDRLRILWPIS